jgi:ssDNA-specific exonuclease RecJ
MAEIFLKMLDMYYLVSQLRSYTAFHKVYLRFSLICFLKYFMGNEMRESFRDLYEFLNVLLMP